MALSYEYDESDETWPFFLLTILLIWLVPATLLQVYRLVYKKEQEAESNGADLSIVQEKYMPDSVRNFQKSHGDKKSVIFNKRSAMIIVGWTVVSFLVHRITNNDALQESASLLFDPYELLGIGTSATEREVRSSYRKLSVKFHPDKLSKDLSQEERLQLEEQYVLITKAYKALTEEVTRENYLKYGHPDGPQSTSHGIALPKFLIEGSASPLVVVGYFLLLAIVLPYFVSRWWANTQSHTDKGIHTSTASFFVDRLFNNKPSEIITVNTILNWLSHAKEYKLQYPELSTKDIEQLFQDHINRIHSGKLEEVKLAIVSKSTLLLQGLLDVATSFRNTEVSNIVLDTSKVIVQATPNGPYAQILQLPNVDKEKFMQSRVDDIRTLGKLFTYDDEKIGQILGISDKSALADTLTVASNIPHLKVIHSEFKVPGESQVTPSSTPHILLKVLVRSAKHKSFPPTLIPEDKLKEPQDFKSLRDPFAIVNEQPKVPRTFAPYFPTKRYGGWCCLVALQKDAKVIQTPLVVTRLSVANLSKDFDKRIIKDVNAEFNADDWEIGTIKIPLGRSAPPEKGDYFFRIIVKSTEYYGSDIDITMPMQVRDPPKVDDLKDEIFHVNDDTEHTAFSSEQEEESDSDEDENDYEDGSEYTDIDTDTEVEDNEEGEK
ncbi:protein-transporting protein SEC63 Ecym_2374 [Eremothecium cymbalariae DBVPG|uniref:J domain-containing protein n=1 Tax=Eremothecium cymbalariae (strain CBS 270.75 / DBVPG 7215 / KCTC 17166 / NRRL Y-17582) TaxID=931890 RepID=G8JNN9_ERECY|nr:Hypothetical protein Ecym_2374 [Eremothecium cymbalariae DBVPG\